MSRNRNTEFVNTELWNSFRKRFAGSTTEDSYWSDILEFCRITGKNFEDHTKEDVAFYFETMRTKVREGSLKPITVTKKFRELHSFSDFCLHEEKGTASGQDFFYPYLRNMVKEAPLAGSVPVEDMDALLRASSGDIMAYAILTLMYRAGLSSTEVAGLKRDDLFLYNDSVYAEIPQRKDPCYIPEDAWNILRSYMDQSTFISGSVFCNRRGNPLNTMYISRMMKKYCKAAGISSYSAQEVRNSCAFNLFSYGASVRQTAGQMGRTEQQIRRYRGNRYQENLKKKAADLVKIHIEQP